jgi:hypothetical protein
MNNIMKRLLLSLLLVSFISTVFSAKVDKEDARQIALNAYFQKIKHYHDQVDFFDLEIADQYTFSRNGEAAIYAFNFKDYGFIFISAEDAIEPVIGYSIDRPFDASKTPDNFMGLMNEYQDHIEFLRSNNIEASPEINQQWSELSAFDHNGFFPKGGTATVDPLITNTWNQDWPYNYYCPLDAAGPGGRVYVGCVATAMSMIMHYYRYPHQGQGSKSYYIYPYGTLTANFGDTTYDWDGMLDNIGNQVNLPTALIGYHAAISVEMNFGPNGSGAYSSDVPAAMFNYFKYANTISYKQRSFYQLATWKNMVQTELNLKRPIYYSGYEPGGGGHAWILDGYNLSDDMYHFNFGWGGYTNGWYLITDAGGFTSGQGMVHNITPGDPNYPYGCTTDYERTSLVGAFEDGSGPQQNYPVNANCSWLINPQTEQDSVKSLKLNFVTLDTDANDIITIYDGETTNAPVLGTYSGTEAPSGFINSTGNKVLVVFEANGDASTGSGWKIEYSSVLPNFCSGLTTFTQPTGTFDDGSGSFYYRNNTNCMWKIEPQWANGVTITFAEFDTEAGSDVLKVYDASNNQLLGTFSGNQIPDPIFAASGKLFLTFQTDGAVNHAGWTIEYEAGNVGIKNPGDAADDFRIYPNPATSQLNVGFTSNEMTSFTLRLMSVTGKVVYSENVNDFSGSYLNSIDLREISNGVYFLNLITKTGTTTKKVVIR